MIELTIQRGDQRFRDRFRWQTVAKRWTEETGSRMAAAVRSAAPVGKKEVGGHNGQLRDSIIARSHVSAKSATVEIVSNAPHASYVINGTPSHLIQPRNASRLHWVAGGNHYYRYRVNHPGAKPNPFPERALKPLVPTLQGKLAGSVSATLGR